MPVVVYNGPKDVSVSEVPDARIEEPSGGRLSPTCGT